MARTPLTIRTDSSIGSTSFAPLAPFEQADVANGNIVSFPVSPPRFLALFVKSAGGSVLTVPNQTTVEGDLHISPRVISIPAGVEMFVTLDMSHGYLGFEGATLDVGILFSAPTKVSVFIGT